jgi:DNA-binding NarL/FixJ family response regulator
MKRPRVVQINPEFTTRELAIANLLVEGFANDAIARELGFPSQRTVKTHLTKMFLRRGIHGGIKRVKLAIVIQQERARNADPVSVPTSVTVTARQQELIELVAAGLTNHAIARVLGLRFETVRNHLKNIFDRVGVWSRLELALWHEAHRPKRARRVA